jgi:hypothetical protein
VSLASWVPKPMSLVRALAIIVLAAVPIALTWFFLEKQTALAVYRGLTLMVAAITQVGVAQQVAIAVVGGIGAAVATAFENTTPVVLTIVAMACLVQWVFNQWSVAVAAQLPAMVAAFSATDPGRPWQQGLATVAGALIAVGAAAVVKLHGTPRPADRWVAARHAVALAVGSMALLLINRAAGFPHGNWGLLAFCLVFVPLAGHTTAKVRDRVIGTTVGAIVAASIAAVAPPVVCFALAAVCGVLAVTYATMSDRYVQFISFLTPTILLIYGAYRPPLQVIGLAGERVGLTILGGLLALALTIWFVRPHKAQPNPPA